MQSQYNDLILWLEEYPQLYSVLALSALIIGAWIANWIVKRILIRGLMHLLRTAPVGTDRALHDSRVIFRLANIVPALSLSIGIGLDRKSTRLNSSHVKISYAV